MKVNFEERTRILILKSLVLSLINYYLKIWGITNTTVLRQGKELLNFAAKVAVGGMKKTRSCNPCL